MKIIFAGTSAFAVPTLSALCRSGHEVLAVYTQPDRPAGRGRKLTASPVKQFAEARGFCVRQPTDLRATIPELAAWRPDVMVVVAYGLMLPAAVLEAPKFGCINVHASLLPRWRGAAPVARAVEAGDQVTGVSIMQMEAGLDTGPVFATAETPITDTDTTQTLEARLAQLGADTLVAVLAELEHDALRARPQNKTGACYASKLRKDEARIDWSQRGVVLHRKIRALVPWPIASTMWKDGILRVWEVGQVEPNPGRLLAPGVVLAADRRGVRVQTGDGVLPLLRLQVEGGRPLAVGDFLNGHRIAPGDRLGAA